MLAALAADAAAFIVVIVIDGGGAGGTAVDVGAGAAVDDAWCPCLLLPLLSLVHFALLWPWGALAPFPSGGCHHDGFLMSRLLAPT
jgi:hypothetical protein